MQLKLKNPVLEHLHLEKEDPFFVQFFDWEYFPTPWHYHPEYELVYKTDSYGKRIVGNTVTDFKAGDISFFGPNLPHVYKNPAEYYEGNQELRAQCVVIHFLENCLGKNLIDLPRAENLKQLLILSRQGIDIVGETKTVVGKKLLEIVHVDGLKKIIILLEILEVLANNMEDCRPICNKIIIGSNQNDGERMDAIFKYVLQNFQEEIKLEKLANQVHMTRTSFCRFFKTRTKKKLSDFVMDVRLNHAAKLLSNIDYSISRVASESGYNNLSNFNRQFKQKFELSPMEYKKNIKMD